MSSYNPTSHNATGCSVYVAILETIGAKMPELILQAMRLRPLYLPPSWCYDCETRPGQLTRLIHYVDGTHMNLPILLLPHCRTRRRTAISTSATLWIFFGKRKAPVVELAVHVRLSTSSDADPNSSWMRTPF